MEKTREEKIEFIKNYKRAIEILKSLYKSSLEERAAREVAVKNIEKIMEEQLEEFTYSLIKPKNSKN